MLLAVAWALLAGSAAPQAVSPTVAYRGWEYALSDRGGIAGRSMAGGGEAEIQARHAAGAAARANAPVWRVKVLVFVRAAVLEQGTDGLARLRRGVLWPEDVERVQADLASFAKSAEAYADGHLRVELHTEVREGAIRAHVQEPGSWPFAEEFLRETVSPEVNGIVFEPGDPVYRGPFDSVFVIHPGLMRAPVLADVLGTPASSVPLPSGFAAGDLEAALVWEWTLHVMRRARAMGFGVPERMESVWRADGDLRDPDAFMAPAVWASFADSAADSAAYVARAGSRSGPAAWEQVRENPYQLGVLSAEAIAERLGRAFEGGDPAVEGFDAHAPAPRSYTGGVDGRLELGVESVAAVEAGDRRLLFVRWPMADLFGTLFATRLDARPIGVYDGGAHLYVVFDARSEPAPQPEVNLLRLEGIEVDQPPTGRDKPFELHVWPQGEWAMSRDGRPVALPDELATGPRLVRLEGQGKGRWMAVAWSDPARLELLSPRMLGGDTLAMQGRLSAPPDVAGTIRWVTPPGWKAPDAAPWSAPLPTLTAPPDGALSQEVRAVLEAGGARWAVPVKVSRQETPSALDLRFGGRTLPHVSPGMVVRSVDVPGRGAVAEIEQGLGVRVGQIDVLKAAGGAPVLHTGRHRYVELVLDTSEAEPMDVVVQSREVSLVLGALDSAGGAYGSVETVLGSPEPGWRTVVLDLGAKAEEIVAVRLVSRSGLAERLRALSRLRIQSVRVLAEPPRAPDASREVRVTADPASENPYARALAARSDASLLADPSPLVSLNAAAGLRNRRDPSAVPALTELIRNLEPAVVREAIGALAHQDTAEAWAAIRETLESGLSDEAREAAATALAGRSDPRVAAMLTSLIIAKDPAARVAGAAALGSLPGPEPAQMLLVYLQDVSPAVRLEVVRRAAIDLDVVARRIQFESVNDLSDAVRAASYLALTRSSLPGMADEGYRGVRDDSPAVRLALLEAFRASPDARHRRALQLAVADTDPRVRAAALRAFAVLPGDVTLEELGGVLEERDPRVQVPLIELADAKKLALSEATLVVLRQSVDRRVSEWARGRGTR